MHLNGEMLARLVDEAPNAEEEAHLASCEACAAELEAYRQDREALAALGPVIPPAGSWERLEARMRDEQHAAGRRSWTPQLRAAAAALIFIAGSVTGGTLVAFTGLGAEAPAATPQLAQAPAADVGTADAEEDLRAAEEQYLRAVDRYAEYTEPAGPIDPVNRLAALEGILLTTEAALRDAPADPIINNYHIATLGLREALIRQLSEDGDTEEEWF